MIKVDSEIEKEFKFDQKKDVPLTEVDKENLRLLDFYKNIEWFVQSHTLTVGQTLNDFIFEDKEDQTKVCLSDITVKCLTECYFCTLENEEYFKCHRKMQAREENKMIEFVLTVPQFRNYTMTGVKNVIQIMEERKLTINQYIQM